jgi:hypothetical protein
MKKLFEHKIFCFFCLLSILTSQFLSGQKIFIEEFTRINDSDYAKTHLFVDSVASQMNTGQYIIVKRYSDFPTFVTESVNDSLYTVIDGKYSPVGQNATKTLNLTSTFLDSIQAAKKNKVNFFGFEMRFSDDFKSISCSSGVGTSSGIPSQAVYMSRLLVERSVDLEGGIGNADFKHFTHIFRGYNSYRSSFIMPSAGSHHEWAISALPKNIINLSNLDMIVILEDRFGNILDCDLISAPFVDEFRMTATNSTLKQKDYCTDKVVPKLTLKNTSPYFMKGFHFKITVNDRSTPYYVNDSLIPGQEKIFSFDQIQLSPGRHYVQITIDSLANTNRPVKITATNETIRYLVAGNHEIVSEGFEDLPDGSTGNFMVRSQNDFTWVKVNADSVGHSKPIGGYGMSEHAVMVDLYNWVYDKDDAGIAYLPDNKNKAFFHYSSMDLTGIKYPTLQFDIATPLNANLGLEIGAINYACTNGTEEIAKFTPTELTKLGSIKDKFYLPESSHWLTKRVALDKYADNEMLQVRFLTNCPYSKKTGNAMYFDNFKIVSDTVTGDIGDMILKSQQEVNQFIRDFGHLNILRGNLCIGRCDDSTKVSDVNNLSGLTFIREIQGALRIKNNPNLTSLNGLNLLVKIDGDLGIINNKILGNHSGLKPLSAIGGSIIIENNPLLTELSLHANNTQINGDFIISSNPSIKKIEPFINLNQIGGNLIISNLNYNVFQYGLSKLSKVSENVSISNNSEMVGLAITGLLNHVGGDFILSNNPKILPNLVKLKYVGGNLIIDGCEDDIKLPMPDSAGGSVIIKNNLKLANIARLDSLDVTYLYHNMDHPFAVELMNNPNLSDCATDFICLLLKDENKPLRIDGNGVKCKSNETVDMVCNPSANNEIDFKIAKIYPNPVIDKLHIESQMTTYNSIKILNSTGQTLYHKRNNTDKEIDVQFLKAGLYTLFIDQYTIKFIKI